MGGLFKGPKTNTSTSNPNADAAFNMARPILDYASNQGLQFGQNAIDAGVYSGPTFAGFTDYQNQAQTGAGNYATNAANNANTINNLAMNNLVNSGDFAKGFNQMYQMTQSPFGAFNMGNKLANSDMANNLVNASTRDIGRNLYENALPNANRGYAATGNMNSNRAGMQDALLMRGAQDRAADVSSQIRNQLFNQGVNQYNTNFNQGMNSLGAMSNAFNNSIANIGTGMNMDSQGINMLNKFGTLGQINNQGQMDADQKAFYDQFNVPMSQLQQMMQLASGNQGYGGSTTGTSQQNPSAMQNIGNVIGIASSLATLCWVAREVYGPENPKWLEFREYMIERAPWWLNRLYWRFGQRFAAFIKDKPRIKKFLQKIMDKLVEA
jgi:hypothetical protein